MPLFNQISLKISFLFGQNKQFEDVAAVDVLLHFSFCVKIELVIFQTKSSFSSLFENENKRHCHPTLIVFKSNQSIVISQSVSQSIDGQKIVKL